MPEDITLFEMLSETAPALYECPPENPGGFAFHYIFNNTQQVAELNLRIILTTPFFTGDEPLSLLVANTLQF